MYKGRREEGERGVLTSRASENYKPLTHKATFKCNGGGVGRGSSHLEELASKNDITKKFLKCTSVIAHFHYYQIHNIKFHAS